MAIAIEGRIKATVGPGNVPNADPLQTYNQHIKFFHFHQLSVSKTAVPGAAQHP